MKFICISLLFLCAMTIAEEKPVMMSGAPEYSARTRRLSKKYQSHVKVGRLRNETNFALDAMIRLAAYELKMDGNTEEADKLLGEWEEKFQFMLLDRGITDHAPLSQWLAEKTIFLQLVLGKDLFHSLRLDDLITINFAIPVCLSCIDNVDETEYFNHFVEDHTYGYRGLGQVITYWGTFFSCVGLSWGTGFLFCSPIAMGTEWISLETWIPAVNKPLWQLVCHQ